MRVKPSLDWLLVLVPVSIVLELAGGSDLAIFLTSAAAILPSSSCTKTVISSPQSGLFRVHRSSASGSSRLFRGLL